MGLIGALGLFVAAAAAGQFDYDARLPIDLKENGVELRDGIRVRDVTYAGLKGGRVSAYLVTPPGRYHCAGILFVHWMEPEAKDSNRTQFLGQAVELARKGTISLLIDAPWSDRQWFQKRKREDDYARSVRQVKDLRRALDVLLAQKRVDRKRIAYVGHDFGMMYGALLPSVDGRPAVYALQAGTTSFSDWFLLGRPQLEGKARQKFIDQLAPLDPVKYIGAAEGRPVLMQFGTADRFVPKPKAEEFFAAAKEPKKILFYETGHGLNEQAVKDRQKWLSEHLRLRVR